MTAQELHEALHDHSTTLEITYGMSLTGGGTIPGVRIITKTYAPGSTRAVKNKIVLYPATDGPQTVGEVFRALGSIADKAPGDDR